MHHSTFEYIKPTETQTDQMQCVREAAKTFADVLLREVPDGPDKTHCIRQLRTLTMWANVAIIRQPDGAPR